MSKHTHKVEHHHAFNIGEKRIVSLLELSHEIMQMPEEEFSQYVGHNHNHFANWIRDILHEPELARKIDRTKTKEETLAIMDEFMNPKQEEVVIVEDFKETALPSAEQNQEQEDNEGRFSVKDYVKKIEQELEEERQSPAVSETEELVQEIMIENEGEPVADDTYLSKSQKKAEPIILNTFTFDKILKENAHMFLLGLLIGVLIGIIIAKMSVVS